MDKSHLKIAPEIKILITIFMKNLENLDVQDFSSKFCFSMWIILHVRGASYDEFLRSSCSTSYVFFRVQVMLVFVHFFTCSGFCSSSGELQRLLQFIWRNDAVSVVTLATLMTKHLLNSLPRGNLVDGVPRAAS